MLKTYEFNDLFKFHGLSGKKSSQSANLLKLGENLPSKNPNVEQIDTTNKLRKT